MNKIRELLDGHIVDYVESDMTTVTVEKSKLKKVLSLLKEDIDLKFTQLVSSNQLMNKRECIARYKKRLSYCLMSLQL